MRIKSLFVFAIIAMLSGHSSAEELTPSEIFEKVKAAYKSMETYQAEGTITSNVETPGTKLNTKASFSILLKKPNLYLITWGQDKGALPGISQSGAVWSDGTQPYLYMGIMNAYSKIGRDELALAAATGISGGVADTIPSLFFSAFPGQGGLFLTMKSPQIEKSEKVGEDDCYVISGSSSTSKKEAFWVSKKSYLIRKYYQSLESPKGGRAIPEMTEAQLEEAIKALGQEVTEESKKNMRKIMTTSTSMLKNTEMKGFSTELHAKVSSPELHKSDFKFALPEGVVLKDSLFDGVFGGGKGISSK